jgi:hypothetical protein
MSNRTTNTRQSKLAFKVEPFFAANTAMNIDLVGYIWFRKVQDTVQLKVEEVGLARSSGAKERVEDESAQAKAACWAYVVLG